MGPCSSKDFFVCLFRASTWSEVIFEPNTNIPSMGADMTTVTISGYSGGSAVTGLESIIFSDTIKGAGMFCGFQWVPAG